jgi:hypothetical protein
LAKVEEWVDRSQAQVRADVAHERLVALGFAGDERITRRAVRPAGVARCRRRGGGQTVTVEHVAPVAVRHPEVVAAGRHYGMQVSTCVPFDPQFKGGAEASVRIAKADLVPTETNSLDAYPDMTALQAACDAFCSSVNGRRHRRSTRC